jgi:hypothetical protein
MSHTSTDYQSLKPKKNIKKLAGYGAVEKYGYFQKNQLQ